MKKESKTKEKNVIPYTKLNSKQTKNGKFSTKIQFWYDSVKEAKDCMELLNESRSEKKDHVMEIFENSLQFSKHKTGYRNGKYWQIENITRMSTFDDIIRSSVQIIEVIKWQHQDFIISYDGIPKLTIETTEHQITWNNVAQRMPRLIQSVNCGTPTIIFQRIGERTTEQNLGWYLQTLVNATNIYKIPCVGILFDDNSRDEAEKKLSNIMIELLDYLSTNNQESRKKFEELLWEVHKENKEKAEKFYKSDKLLRSGWLEITDKEVKVIPGVKPSATMWKTKGTGGLDPYPGLVVMADILLCRTGPSKNDRRKSLTVKFRHIKEDFWWFKKYPTELYLQMLIDPEYRISDTVEYLEEDD
tara:strand:+ start:141 stop:1217 length:1077 start_codon:yes stop_codon:yes gene_type:complete